MNEDKKKPAKIEVGELNLRRLFEPGGLNSGGVVFVAGYSPGREGSRRREKRYPNSGRNDITR